MSLIEHLEKLRHFHKLTNYRSINEGAKAMGISQAGLSKSISGLEGVLETPLFIRSNEGLVLTKEGELVLKTTKRILSEASELETNLRSLKAAHLPDSISVGMYDSIAVYFFEELQGYLRTVYPEVKLQLVVDKSSKLADLIESGEVDLSIGVNMNKKKSKELFFPLFDDHYSFYVSHQNQGSLSDLPILVHPEATDENGTTNKKHIEHNFKNRLIHEVHNFETLKVLTAQNVGIGILPTQVAKPMIQQKILRPAHIPKVKQLFGPHQIGFLVTHSFMKKHGEFASDVMRLGERRSKI